MKIDKMKSLNHREQAREKLPVFYGSRDNYLHGLREVINNGVDEILNNFTNGVVEVSLHDDLRTISVKDTGRGIAIQAFDEEGIPYYEVIFETLFAGGKMDNSDLSNSGVNGLGTCVLNYTSELFEVEVCSQGRIYKIKYKNGGIDRTPLIKGEEKDDHYTKITFRLDEEMYINVKYDYKEIREIINKTAKVSPNITFKLLHNEKIETFHYSSLKDYFESHSKDNIINPLVGKSKIYTEQDGEKTKVEIVLSCSDGDQPLQECMLNGNNLILSSSISEGVVNGVRNFVHKYSRDNKLYNNKEKNINTKDIESCISFVCNVFSNRVEFQGQTKFSTEKKLYRDVVSLYVQENLEVFAVEKKEDFIRLVNQVFISKRAIEKSEKLLQKTKKELTEKINNMDNRVDGFIDCKIHDENSEFFICEGKSAMGSVISSRNPNFQAGFAIRGKILSCLKANYETIFKNVVIKDLIKIMGCGVEINSKHNKELSSFNINNLRFGKIIISTDSDFDGESIQVLLLTMIYRLMPQLIFQGKIYITQTPKFVIRNNEDKHYAFTDAEKDELVKKLKGKVKVGYVKGLGELNPIDMYNTALNPDTRKMIKVTIGDVEKMIEKFNVWMDEDVTLRKEFIQNHLHEYINDQE